MQCLQNKLQTTEKAFNQLLKIIGAGLLTLVLTGYAVWAYAQERHDLPPFDLEKAKALSPEKRAEYDRLLFNELPDWSGGSRRHNLFTREDEWKKMAAEGHELSYLTLTVSLARLQENFLQIKHSCIWAKWHKETMRVQCVCITYLYHLRIKKNTKIS